MALDFIKPRHCFAWRGISLNPAIALHIEWEDICRLHICMRHITRVMSYKGVCGRAGISAVPAVLCSFLVIFGADVEKTHFPYIV